MVLKRVIFGVLLIGLMVGIPVVQATDTDSIIGVWTTAEGKSKVEIFGCGESYCGRIISLKEPTYPADDKQNMAGKPKVDRENPSPELRSRPLVGLQIMEGFKAAGPNSWEGGTIYDPKSGKTYKCKMNLSEPNKLKVRGFIGVSLLGRTEIWTR